MKNYNRQDQLRQLHKQKKENTNTKVSAAIMKLLKAGASINFNSVSKESGITKATLYNNVDIRSSIEQLRAQQAALPSPSEMKREMSEQSKDALIASLKRKIKQLKEENNNLRRQVNINYAQFYENI